MNSRSCVTAAGTERRSKLKSPAGACVPFSNGGGILDHKHRRAVRVVIADTENAQRPLGGQRDRVALPPVERRAPVGGRVGG
jgi:hypothetical protein